MAKPRQGSVWPALIPTGSLPGTPRGHPRGGTEVPGGGGGAKSRTLTGDDLSSHSLHSCHMHTSRCLNEHSSTYAVSERMIIHVLGSHNQKGLQPSAVKPFSSSGPWFTVHMHFRVCCWAFPTHFSSLNSACCLKMFQILVSSHEE